MSTFGHIEPFAGDPILSLNEAFVQDPRSDKTNLSIGIYFDDDGKVPVLESVRAAEHMLSEHLSSKPYLPMEGLASFRRLSQELVFGADHPLIQAGRLATIQTVGSSGGLRVTADFVARWFKGTTIHVSEPSWENHRGVFGAAGLTVGSYTYYDAATGGVNFPAMCTDLRALPKGSMVLLHACCHNPTGADLSVAQWDELAQLVKSAGLLAFIDMAYQGFGQGLREDAYGVQAMVRQGVPLFVTNSYSKNLSVYGERCGALSVVCESAEEADLVLGQLKQAVRCSYSNPPLHGAQLVATVLGTAPLRSQWEGELVAMRTRIQAMRQRLHDGLSALVPGHDFGFILKQQGMFSYMGLTPAQVERLKAEHGVYILKSARLCIAGLNAGNVDKVVRAVAAVMA